MKVIQSELQRRGFTLIKFCSSTDSSEQYFLILRRFSAFSFYDIILDIISRHKIEPSIEKMKSPHFKITQCSNERQGDKTHLLMHLQFAPEDLPKYTYKIALRTENSNPVLVIILALSESLNVTGPHAVTFPSCLVHEKSQKIITFKTDAPSLIKFRTSTFGPFSVHPSHGVMCAANEARLLVTFTPREVSAQQGLLIFVCEKGEELVCELNGEGHEAAVALSTSSISLPETLMGTYSFASFSIQNGSKNTVNFKWNSMEHFEAFLLQPLEGIIMPNSSRDLHITFSPDFEKEFAATALCTVSGRKEPLRLSLFGRGKGPVIEYSFTSMDIGKSLVTTAQSLELILHNRSEIKATFSTQLKPEDCEVAPQEGTITAHGYQIVLITFRSSRLGPFTKDISFKILGSSKTKSITISGEFVPPELVIEPSSVDFGRVAFGFGVTKVVKVQNVSKIPISIIFEAGMQSLSVGPSQVLLRAMDTTEMEVSYSASEVTTSDSCICINMEAVGKIFEIPVAVRCCVPQIQTQCSRFDLESCFFNHPREFTVPLANLSDLPAKYCILPVENANVQVTLASPQGLLPPEKVTFVPLQVNAKVTGVVSLNLEIIIDGADYNPLVVEVVCHCVGPVLFITAEKVDFGRIEALTPIRHAIVLYNESPIPAHLTSIRIHKSTAFRVSPSELTMPPFGRTEVEVTACANDVDVEISGLLEIYVQNCETSPYTILLKAIGVGNTITIEPDMPLNLPLGQQFEALPQGRVFVVKNCGRRQQRLVWMVEDIICIQKAENTKKSKEPEYEIHLDPPKFELKPFQSMDFFVKVVSVRSMEIKFTLKCYTVIGNAGHKRLLRECAFSVEFIKPMIEVVPNPIGFCLLKVPEKAIENAYQRTVITNLAEIETTLQVTVDEPFFLIEYERLAQSLELTLSGKGERGIWVGFAPPLGSNGNVSFAIDTHLTIVFLKHPLKLAIPVCGEVHFPSLRPETDSLDFGSVENGSKVVKSLLLFNTSPIKVNYQWKLSKGSLRCNEREPLRLPTRSRSQELCQAPVPLNIRSSSIANIDALHITDVFTITPESGTVPVGESVSARIEFHAPSDVSASCVAICDVSDGINCTLHLKGECSTSDCYIRTKEVSFGEIQFDEEAVESFLIYNAGKVPSSFCFTCDRNDVNLQILPMEGEVPGRGLAEIAMHVVVPRPREFTVFAKVRLGGNHPEQIRVHGKACFPHVVVNSLHTNSGSLRDGNLCNTERDFIAAQLAAERPNLPLILPSYELNLCGIIRGEVKESKLTFTQLCHEFAYQLCIEKMSRKVLAKKGVTVQIEDEIYVTFDSSDSETGQIDLEIPLKIHRHVILPIRLTANVVAPELKISANSLYFGDVHMDEAKVMAVQLHNPTPFPINWSDSRPRAAASAFELMPKSGSLQPDQKANVFVKYKPRIGGPVSEKIDLLLQEGEAHLQITCQGVGLEPRLLVQPSEVEFKPLLPNGETDEQTVIIKNPCSFPVEFYSLDFDEVYTQEEQWLTCLPLFDEAEEALLPPRKPGESLPIEVYEHLLQVKQPSLGPPKTGRLRSSRRGTTKQALEHLKKLPPHSSSLGGMTTFRGYVEERRVGVEADGIVLLVFGSPFAGKSDLANSLARYYDAAHLNLDEFFANLSTTDSKDSEEDALSARFTSPDCTFGLVVSEISSSARCEVVLKALGKKRMNVFAVTVTRDLASISLADARYEEALDKAEKCAFERKVTEYRNLEEWQYDALPDSAREEVNSILAEWKRQQYKESKEVTVAQSQPKSSSRSRNLGPKSSVSSESLNKAKYADLGAKLKEFEKVHRRISQLLSTWDTKNQEQRLNGVPQPPIALDSPKSISSHSSDDYQVGIPHFVVHSKLDVEIKTSFVDQVYECVEDVQREEPNISVVLKKLLPHLPAREEIRRQLGFGPLPVDIPTPTTFSIVRRPFKREKCKEVNHFFAIVKSPCLVETMEAADGSQSASVLSAMTPRSQRTSTSSSSRGKRGQGKALFVTSEQNFCCPSIYRWVVPENGQIQLTLRFSPKEVGDFRELLKFEILRNKEEFTVECQGCCQLPQLITEPRMMFSKIAESYPPNKPPRKTFLIDKNCFHFGPLLAAKTRDRILAGEYKENVAEIKLQNDGPHDVELKLAFEANEDGENFAVSPSEICINRDETEVAKVFALPAAMINATSKLIGWIKDNPEPIIVDFAVIGVLPNLTVQTKVVNFGKIPLNKTEQQQITIRNPTPIPVAWKCEFLGPIEEQGFTVHPISGILDSSDEIGSIMVEYNGSSNPQKIAIKRWLRLVAMDTRGLSNPVMIDPPIGVQVEAVDPEFEIAMPREGLDFGLIRVQEESEKSLELRNHGPFKLRYKFRAVLPQKKQMDLPKALIVNPQSGILLPSQNLTITIHCNFQREVEVHNEAAFVCEVETHKGIPISSTPILISVVVRHSHFKILPSKKLAFGPMVINTRASEQVTIENDGAFDLYYSILPKANKIKACLAKRESGQRRSSGAGARERISQGPFIISPTKGTIPIGQKQPITAQCSTGPIKATFEEEFVIRIADKPNSGADAVSVPLRLSVEVCSPSLETEDMSSIFEEHSVCQSRSDLERLANYGIAGAAYVEDENCFDFGVTQIGIVSRGRFRIFNNSKAGLDVSFRLNQTKPEKRQRMRRSDLDASEAFNVVPTISHIEPYQSVYVICSFTSKLLGVYSTTFQVLAEGRSAPLLQFDLRGAGEIPRVSVEEPSSRNSQGNLYLLFNKNQTSRVVRMRNDGAIPCQTKVDVKITEGAFGTFRLNDCEFRRKEAVSFNGQQTSVSFTLAVGKTHSLEVTFVPLEGKSGGRVTGCVKIYSQGNDYEKEIIELVGDSPEEFTSAPQIYLMNSTMEPLDFEEVNTKHMNLGDCYVGSPIISSLVLSYPFNTDVVGLTASGGSELPSFNFTWPQDHPHLVFEPATGELHPGSSLTVFVKFHSNRPVTYRSVPVRCELIQTSKMSPQKGGSELTEKEAVDKALLCSTRSAGTPRRRVKESLKSQRKSLSARSGCPQESHPKDSTKANVADDEKEKKEDRKALFLDFYYTIACGLVEYLCEADFIEFADTPLYCESVKSLQIRNVGTVTMTFRLEKVDDGDEPFEVDICESLIPPGKSVEVRLTFRPTHSGKHECNFVLRVPCTETESTASKSVHVIGKGFSIPIHLRLPKCDYEARHLPADPLWYTAQTLVLVGTGIGYKVARSFEITNASETSVELTVKKVDSSDVSMDIVPSATFIKPGHSIEVEVSFVSQTKETKEVRVIFEANGHHTPLLLVGQTREAIVAFDRSHLQIPELPVGRAVEDVVHLVNTEAIPVNFKINKSTLHCNESLDELSISPMGGCIQPNGRLPLKIHFTPTEERKCNFNILCKVQHRQRPLRLNVKTSALKCFVTAWLFDDCSEAKQEISPFLVQCLARDVVKSTTLASRRVVDFPSLREDLTIADFGEVFIGCDSTRLLKLTNHGDYEMEFGSVVTTTLKNAVVPFSLTPAFGRVEPLKETLLQIAFKPDSPLRVPTQKTNFLGVIALLNGPAFALDLRGCGAVNPVDISPGRLDFGPQFTQETGLGVITKCVKISNSSSDKPVYVTFASSALLNFNCDFSPQMIEPASTVDAKVTFCPSACKNYESELCFLVNEKAKIKIPVRGRGVKLDIEVNCGSLLINQEREGKSKTPVKVRDCKQADPSIVHLGNLAFMQSGRRIVEIMNKSPAPITITGASVVPKLKALNKVFVNALTSRPNGSDILSLNFLPPLPFARSNKKLEREKRGNVEVNRLLPSNKDPAAQMEVIFSPRDLPIMPFSEDVLLRISTAGNPDKCIWMPAFTICGKCSGAKVVLETSLINFGTVVVGSSCCKTIAISNRGNESARFMWDERTLPRHLVSIEPKRGSIHANTSMNFNFTFKPIQVDQELHLENVTCNIEGSRPLHVALVGVSSASPEVAEIIQFACAVRERDTQSVSLSNPTNSVWTIKPVLTGAEWSGEGVFAILPKGSVDYAITYHPLNMTSTDEAHRGSIFFPLPNGSGVKFRLEGTSNPPNALKPKIAVEIPCKRKFDLQIDVPNWLSRLQRFYASWRASNESNFTFSGPQFIDVPGGESKKYPLSCLGLSEASTTLKVTFSCTDSEEYQFIEYQLRAIRPKPEGLIKLKTPLRKSVTYQLGLENPLRRNVVVALHSTLPELTCPPEYELTSQSQSMISLDFKPWRIGKFIGSLEVSSSELGLNVYDLELEALEPLPEKPVKFQANLGQFDTTAVKISNLSRSRAEFTCKTTNSAFRCEKSVLVATNSSAELPVTFEPNRLGASEGTLKVTSSQAGSFIFPLYGFAKPPPPQGPFLIGATAPTPLAVRNVFAEPIEFALEVDNTAFRVECFQKVVNPHKELRISVTLEPRDYPSDVHGRLVVSCNPSTPGRPIQWVFYLKGVTAT